MTLEEKAKFLIGDGFWHTHEFAEYDIPKIMLTDGPHGLRKQGVAGDHLGIAASLPSTCFPTSATTACSFDVELLEEIGQALGDECRKEDVAVILGPGADVKRNPLCGRNFEYFSEDPIVSGKLSAAWIRGVQSRGVGTSIKHFVGNSQEKFRLWTNSIIDKRALRELYLKSFEIAIKESKPWTIMTAYNRLNGKYCSENEWLLTELVEKEWGYDGLFVTDWGAISDRAGSFKAGLDLEMPGSSKQSHTEIVKAYQKGELSMELIEERVNTLKNLIDKSIEGKKRPFECDMEKNGDLAQRAAEESAVLLKNENALPLKAESKIALIGRFAENPRYQGAGSSKICPIELDDLLTAMKKSGADFDYAPAYGQDGATDESIKKAVEAASGKDAVVLVIGLPDIYESEGYDRESMELPEAHNRLVEEVTKVSKNVIVLLQGGSPMALPWSDKVQAILCMYLSGQRGGEAALNLLFGKATPQGKLAESWPITHLDAPSHETFSTGEEHIQYRESIYVGYRYYEKAQKPVAFPFGYGLSYTNFKYSGLQIDNRKITLSVENTGTYPGGEIVQVYLSLPDSAVYRPVKELKSFAKVKLKPGEKKQISMELSEDSFQWYDPIADRWSVENGTYQVLIGASSQDIRLTGEITITLGEDPQPLNYPYEGATQQDFEKLLGYKIPSDTPLKPFTKDSLIFHTLGTIKGKLLLFFGSREAASRLGGNSKTVRKKARESIENMPLRNLSMAGASPKTIEGVVDIFNSRYLTGLKKILSKH